MLLPEGKSGEWSIEHFTVTDEDVKLHNLRCAIKPGMHGREMIPGTYMRLKRGRALVMSNTPAEKADYWAFVHHAKGNVLINGLGLGCVLRDVLVKPEVERVTVIEISPDVIKLVAPHFDGERLTIINDDAMTWVPPRGERYDAVWHDIWDDICADNLPKMRALHRKYGRRSAYQESWCRHLCRLYA